MSPCDIKSLYTNIRHDVFYKTIDYWIEKLINETPSLRRFTKAFILEELSIKGNAMGTIFAVVESNLTVAYFEEKIVDFVDFFYV